MTKSVFVSYSSEDKNLAFTICHALEDRGIGCWIAPRDVTPGADYLEEILGAIENAEVMVLLLSSRSNSSRHVRNEVERAVSKGKAILPVRIEDVRPSRGLELLISSHHWVDALPPLGDKVERLEGAIKALLGRGCDHPAPSPRCPEPAAETYPRPAIITGNRVFVRSGPTVVAKYLHQVHQGEDVQVLQEVTVHHSRECQLRDDLDFVGQDGTTYRLQAGRGLVISGENDTQYRIEFSVEGRAVIGHILKAAVTLMEPAHWCKIRTGEIEGWVFGAYVRVY